MLPHILAEPLFLQIWVFWLIVINTACIFFLRQVEARWVLVAWVGNILFMTALFELNGFNRLLSLSHVVSWTPLVIYLHRRRDSLSGERLFDGWVRTLFVTNLISLAIDYVEIVRYLLGDRG
ncbi:MAG: hypothetical protein OEM62_00065 [Acidobacteriota bacterium]|nr:hypothetical protein [Acidobacteriota bacterium]